VAGRGDDVEVSVVVEAGRATVFRCLTQDDLLSRWLQAAVRLEPRVGGSVRIDFARYGTVVEGRVVEVVPDRALAFTWGVASGPEAAAMPPGSTTVRISLEDAPDGTRVVLRHQGIPTDALRRDHAEGWAGYLRSLRATGPVAAVDGTPEALWDRWFRAWGEEDARRRDALVASALAEGGTFVDTHADLAGREAVSSWMATCQRMFPGVTVGRTGAVLNTGNALLCEWEVRRPDGGTMARGVNHGRLTRDGLLASVEAFWRP
jgi:uncharacterized protein YndB with AHSA1/START domain